MSGTIKWISIALLTVSVSAAQDSAVYRVETHNCAHGAKDRVQSGFKLNGTQGIVTALHGVVDCLQIIAVAAPITGSDPIRNLHLEKVSIEADAALISSPELNHRNIVGLNAAIVSPQVGDQVTVTGYPYETDLIKTVLLIRDPPIVQLASRLEPAAMRRMNLRNSPSIREEVLNLQGTLNPGLSGAPITDRQGRVIGLADGGLKEGFSQICWAISLSSVRWSAADRESEALNQLKTIDPGLLFSVASTSYDSPRLRLVGNEEVFGNTIYVLPNGWTANEAPDGRLILKQQWGQATITIAKSQPLYGDFRESFERNLKGLTNRQGFVGFQADEGFDVLRTFGTLGNSVVGVVYVACNPGNSFEQIIFAVPNLNPTGTVPEFERFLLSVDFVNSRLRRQARSQ